MDAAVIASLAGGLAQSAGQLYANSQSLKPQGKTNQANYAIASMNNATQIKLANTAHQREVNDLKAAGINPLLTTGGSGAPVPALTSPEMGTAQVDNPLSGLAGGAKQAAKYISSQYKAQIENIKANSENLRSQNKNLAQQNKLYAAQTAETQARTAKTLAETNHPGYVGDVYRTFKGIGKDAIEAGQGMFTGVRDWWNRLKLPEVRNLIPDSRITSAHAFESSIHSPGGMTSRDYKEVQRRHGVKPAFPKPDNSKKRRHN